MATWAKAGVSGISIRRRHGGSGHRAAAKSGESWRENKKYALESWRGVWRIEGVMKMA
jgi:hypothetical protein